MKEEDWVHFYRSSQANGIRKAADLFKVEKPDIYKYIRELAERTERGEA